MRCVEVANHAARVLCPVANVARITAAYPLGRVHKLGATPSQRATDPARSRGNLAQMPPKAPASTCSRGAFIIFIPCIIVSCVKSISRVSCPNLSRIGARNATAKTVWGLKLPTKARCKYLQQFFHVLLSVKSALCLMISTALPEVQTMGKDTTNSNLGLDIRAVSRAGNLQRGKAFSWRWTYDNDGAPAGVVAGAALESAVKLAWSRNGQPHTQTVPVVWTRCNYGGRRAWWLCPGCARRVAILYLAGHVFACRHCYRLCYGSQLEKQNDRWLRAAWKIRRRLGQRGGGHFDPMPEKPKRMHWETYARLCLRCEEIEALDLMAISKRFGMHF